MVVHYNVFFLVYCRPGQYNIRVAKGILGPKYYGIYLPDCYTSLLKLSLASWMDSSLATPEWCIFNV